MTVCGIFNFPKWLPVCNSHYGINIAVAPKAYNLCLSEKKKEDVSDYPQEIIGANYFIIPHYI